MSSELKKYLIKCSKHSTFVLQRICTSPSCQKSRLLCKMCILEDNTHIIQHSKEIFDIQNLLQEVVFKVSNDEFYFQRKEELTSYHLVEEFREKINSAARVFENTLDVLSKQLHETIERKREEMLKEFEKEKALFEESHSRLLELVDQGCQQERRKDEKSTSQSSMSEFDALMFSLETSKSQEGYLDTLNEILRFYSDFCNERNSDREPEHRQFLKNQIAILKNYILNPPTMEFNHKLPDIVRLLGEKIELKNSLAKNLELKQVSRKPENIVTTYPKQEKHEQKKEPTYGILNIAKKNYFLEHCKRKYIHFFYNSELCVLDLDTLDPHDHSMPKKTPKFARIKLNDADMFKNFHSFSSLITPEGRIVITGGYVSDKKKSTATAYEFNFSTSEFLALANMNFSRYFHAVCYSKSKIFVVGGIWADGDKSRSLADCEYYDCKEDRWVEIAPCFYPAHKVALCAYNDSFLLKVGGFSQGASSLTHLRQIERYGIYSNKWEEINPFGLSNFGHITLAECAPISDKEIIVFGGTMKINGKLKNDLSFAIKVREAEDYDVLCSDDLLEIEEEAIFQMPFATFTSTFKNAFLHNGLLYVLSSAHRLLSFDGANWDVVL